MTWCRWRGNLSAAEDGKRPPLVDGLEFRSAGEGDAKARETLPPHGFKKTTDAKPHSTPLERNPHNPPGMCQFPNPNRGYFPLQTSHSGNRPTRPLTVSGPCVVASERHAPATAHDTITRDRELCWRR